MLFLHGRLSFWHEHIQDSAKDFFDLRSIHILENAFNLNTKQSHHSKGESLKLKLIAKSIKENMGKSILFTNCTLFLNKDKMAELQCYINSYKEMNYDFMFAGELNRRHIFNISFILIQYNEKTLHLSNDLLEQFSPKS